MTTPNQKLGNVAQINPRPSQFPQPDEIVSFAGMADLDAQQGSITQSVLRPFSEVCKGYTPFEAGDILVAKITPCFENCKIGEASIPLDVGYGSTEFHVIRPLPTRLDRRYLLHFLRQERVLKAGERRMTGSAGQKRVPVSFFEELEIPLPPLEEQRRIAAILDRAGNLGQHAKGQLFIAKNLLASLFVETIGDPLKTPHDWTTLPLAEAVQAGTDVTYGIVQAGEEYPGGVPYIRTGDIVDGEIDVSALRHTNPAIARRFTRSTVRAGEIVMSIRATVGTTAVVPVCLDGANLTQGTARVAPGENVNGVYLLQYLRMPSTQAWIQRQVKGATFREITLARLRELPVLIPPMAIQDEFAVKAKIANSVIGSSKVLLGRIENLSQSLCNQLLGRKY